MNVLGYFVQTIVKVKFLATLEAWFVGWGTFQKVSIQHRIFAFPYKIKIWNNLFNIGKKWRKTINRKEKDNTIISKYFYMKSYKEK